MCLSVCACVCKVKRNWHLYSLCIFPWSLKDGGAFVNWGGGHPVGAWSVFSFTVLSYLSLTNTHIGVSRAASPWHNHTVVSVAGSHWAGLRIWQHDVRGASSCHYCRATGTSAFPTQQLLLQTGAGSAIPGEEIPLGNPPVSCRPQPVP